MWRIFGSVFMDPAGDIEMFLEDPTATKPDICHTPSPVFSQVEDTMNTSMPISSASLSKEQKHKLSGQKEKMFRLNAI